MSMANHVTKVCQAGYFQLLKIYKICKYLTDSACESIVHAFVTLHENETLSWTILSIFNHYQYHILT